MAKKLGFSLSGGGAKGIAHAGFLKAMEENGIKPDVVTGCSMGAVVGGCYCAGVGLDELKNCLVKLTRKDLLDFNLNVFDRRGIFAGKKMLNLLKKYVGTRDIKNLNVTYGCIATDLISGKLVDLTSGDLALAIRASASIPAVFEPVDYNDKLLVDGGVLVRNPVKLAKKLGADVVVGVDVLGGLSNTYKCKKLFDVGMRTFSVIDNLYCAKLGTKTADLMIYPQIKNVETFNFKNLKLAYDAGYKIGLENVKNVKKLVF